MRYNAHMAEKFELDAALADEIRARVLGDGFMKLVQSVRRGGTSFRIALRPVEIRGEKRFQAEMTDDGHVQVKNFDANGAAEGLEEIIAQKGARELHVMTAKGDLHVRVTKKGHALVSRSAEMDRVAVVKPHDRVKNVPLAAFDAGALLRAIDLADGSGKIRASMRGKYDQVNEFLKVVGDVLKEREDKTLKIVDCGCGKSYLTFALHAWLVGACGYTDVKVVGIDRRADVIAASRKTAETLDVADDVSFLEGDIGAVELPWQPDLVVSLHACDTATDEALAKAVEWKARYIVSAPCCQHELQKTIGTPAWTKGNATAVAFAGLLRQNILRERLCDILTDSFRALILRVLGFKTQVIEFVSPDATARNILLRAEFCVKPGQPGVVSEYLELRDAWKVTPWLETRMEKMLSKYLKRFA